MVMNIANLKPYFFEEKKETVGAAVVKLMEKGDDKTDVIEQQQAMQEDWVKNILDTVESGKKLYTGDFFVVIETKRERILDRVIRNYFFARQSCPSPNYDQTVYHYKSADERLDFLWVIPSKDACLMLKENALTIDRAERELLLFVLDFFNGTLEKQAMQLNGETVILM